MLATDASQGRALRTGFNYFRSQQSNNIVAVKTGTLGYAIDSFQYQNVSGLLFEGGQWDLKRYATTHLMAEALALYQTNRNAMKLETKMPTAGFGAKAGLSYANRKGWTLGLFDVHTGAIPGFTASANPHVGPRHRLAANVRLELEKHLGPAAKRMALFAHGNNPIDRPVWLPAWGYTSAGSGAGRFITAWNSRPSANRLEQAILTPFGSEPISLPGRAGNRVLNEDVPFQSGADEFDLWPEHPSQRRVLGE